MKFFEPLNELRDKCEDYLKRRELGFALVRKFVKKYGGKEFAYRDDFRFAFAVVFPRERPDPRTWKQADRNSPGQFTPKGSTKEGKVILTEMQAVAATVPSRGEIGKWIRQSTIDKTGVWSEPGITKLGDMIILGVRDSYEPHDTVKDDLRRVPDTEYEERLKAAEDAAKKSRKPRKKAKT